VTLAGRWTDPVILIHGAWQGAWVWDRFAPFLRAAGLDSIALDLPGNGVDRTPAGEVSLDLYVSHVQRILEALDGPANLVAHSGGGLVASAVAEAAPERVSRLVYVAGMMLPDRSSFAQVVASVLADDPSAEGVAPHLEWSEDGLLSRVPHAVALSYFFHDCPKPDADAAASRLTPQPERGRAVQAHLTPGRFGRVPRIYVEAAADRAVVPACQRRMQELAPGASIITLPTGHAPHLAAPQLLADALLPFLLAPAPRASTI
jgi:pimeloyl-ACP methyl ester carboxylesterase